MNKPLSLGPYKIYQNSYKNKINLYLEDEQEKKISIVPGQGYDEDGFIYIFKDIIIKVNQDDPNNILRDRSQIVFGKYKGDELIENISYKYHILTKHLPPASIMQFHRNLFMIIIY